VIGPKLSELLTPRELDFARLISEGLSNREIACESRCSEKYINNRLSLLYAKLGYAKGSGSNREPRILLAVRYDREHGRLEDAPNP
jgi:DNA-binding NarL/FixJ family response regulator